MADLGPTLEPQTRGRGVLKLASSWQPSGRLLAASSLNMQLVDCFINQRTPLVVLMPLLQEEQSSAPAAASGPRPGSGSTQQPAGAKSKAKRARQKAAKAATNGERS
jgi:hypothetical protein